MIDFTSRLSRHVNRRLRKEQIIWLTTVDFNDAPQPRPVWFHWDDETILIFSERGKAKLRHIERNPKVSLNFNTDEDGGDVAVIGGKATIMDARPAGNRVKAYLRKYREGIKSLDMTVAEFSAAYTMPILVTPKALRGFVE
jgi:PPOX class probable F420-dependent enzyme